MKQLIFTIIMLPLLCIWVFAQPQADMKRDYIWLLGYGSTFPEPYFGNMIMDFHDTPVGIYDVFTPMNFSETNASICDEEGNLLFYTNGIYIANANHHQMLNGGGLNPGPWTSEYAEGGMIIPQNALILPIPHSPNLYMIFHGLLDIIPGGVGVSLTKVFYSIVDMEKANGLGIVTQKNIPIIQDTVSSGKMTAVRHGNGRDWWIIVPELDSKRYYRLLLTPEGVENLGTQSLGAPVLDGLGQACFSPDGSKYLKYDVWNIIEGNFLNFYDFDRCTGLLSNQLQLHIVDGAYSGGLAISPNSRFAYFSSHSYVYQYDLWADDIAASKDTVAVYDGFTSPYPLPTRFYLAQLAPDGKIYINSTNSVDVLHLIHNPDEKGNACNFEQHGIKLPTLNAFTMPNFPNFRLGKWEGSPCDTISISSASAEYTFSKVFVYPNPASDFIIVESKVSHGQDFDFKLFDGTGKMVLRRKISPGKEQNIDLGGFAPGLYFFRIENTGQLVKAGKLVVIKDN